MKKNNNLFLIRKQLIEEEIKPLDNKYKKLYLMNKKCELLTEKEDSRPLIIAICVLILSYISYIMNFVFATFHTGNINLIFIIGLIIPIGIVCKLCYDFTPSEYLEYDLLVIEVLLKELSI